MSEVGPITLTLEAAEVSVVREALRVYKRALRTNCQAFYPGACVCSGAETLRPGCRVGSLRETLRRIRSELENEHAASPDGGS